MLIDGKVDVYNLKGNPCNNINNNLYVNVKNTKMALKGRGAWCFLANITIFKEFSYSVNRTNIKFFNSIVSISQVYSLSLYLPHISG
ncbi:hypothetical protein CN300_29795 [Bacillus thuringiensis]|uniref:Uncharacterized protein n=1 Tax=Bacillus thuringiensis TaxID=1428 RepID=A0A9X6ZQP0_BACTU|nr:hypothetical protein BK762_18830 [Bacillus thuringiensis serovar toumanoffi]PEC13755.1 hypothetical protein CON19_26940 [Bacillus thuringiensis]PEQ49860.1 hypothetical protein CN473_21100 [Bacillus thuringiensis]PEV06157.1 hypothetical protein CN418_28265 [Bacillus thuringiensis]PEY61960.1 hypothetical protein CN355_30540 [Bacillus thuringiensis]